MDNGWISIHRKLTKWGWYQKSEMVHLFIHLLLMANHEPGEWQGQTIKRGQLVTGRLSLSENTGISQQTIRTCLERLKSTNEITIKSTNRFSIITILKYEDYQSETGRLTSKTTSKLTNNQPTTNQQLTTNNKDKNEKNNIYISLEKQIEPFKDTYSTNTITDFMIYWNEANSSGKKRWQLEKTWDVKLRLLKWKRNQDKWDYEKSQRFIKKEEPSRERKQGADSGFTSIGDLVKK